MSVSERRLIREASFGLTSKLWQISWFYVVLLCLLAAVGYVALYSAAGGSPEPYASRHLLRFGCIVGGISAPGDLAHCPGDRKHGAADVGAVVQHLAIDTSCLSSLQLKQELFTNPTAELTKAGRANLGERQPIVPYGNGVTT